MNPVHIVGDPRSAAAIRTHSADVRCGDDLDDAATTTKPTARGHANGQPADGGAGSS